MPTTGRSHEHPNTQSISLWTTKFDPIRLASATIQAVDRIGAATSEEIEKTAEVTKLPRSDRISSWSRYAPANTPIFICGDKSPARFMSSHWGLRPHAVKAEPNWAARFAKGEAVGESVGQGGQPALTTPPRGRGPTLGSGRYGSRDAT
jgi:hypothetical protein